MKSFLATFVGLIGAFVTMILLEIVGHLLFPTPRAIEAAGQSELQANLANIPTGAYFSVALAHGAGLFIGLLIARAIDRSTMVGMYIIAVFLLLGTISNLFQLPHPVWFAILDVALVVLVGAVVLWKTHRSFQKN